MKTKIVLVSCLVLAAAVCTAVLLRNREEPAVMQTARADAEIAEITEEPSGAENPERVKAEGLTKSAKYNPDLDEYYDSNYLEWDAQQQKYIDVTPEVHIDTDADAFEPDCEIPEALQAELDAFSDAMNVYREENPQFGLRSDFFFLDDTEALRKLESETAVPYFDTYLTMAQGKYQSYRALGTYFVSHILHLYGEWRKTGLDNKTMSAHAGELDYAALYLQEATDAVSQIGDSVTAADCAELQKHYGYLIAPALQDMGKLDLLQIDADSLCQSPEQIAGFARCFADMDA